MAPNAEPEATDGEFIEQAIQPVKDAQGHVDRLEIENFKSYRGHHVIGPFLNFTSVIGPNGSGKSNLMDAISFALGVRSSTIRASSLKDLVCSHTPDENVRSYVSLVYSTPEGNEKRFSRSITPNNSSEYRIDGTAVNFGTYASALEQLGVLVRTRNFLVSQGDVESVAQKTPKDLSSLIEHISGSEELREEYERVRSEKEESEQRVEKLFVKQNSVAHERKEKKEQRDEAQRYKEKEAELADMKRKKALFQLYHNEQDKEQINNDLEAKRQEMETMNNEHSELQEQIEQKKREKAKFDKDAVATEKKKSSLEQQKSNQDREAFRLREQLEKKRKRATQQENEVESKRKEKEEQQERIQQLEEDLENLDYAYQQFEEGEKKKQEQAGIDLTNEQLEEFNSLKEEANRRTQKLQQELDVLLRSRDGDEETKQRLQDSINRMNERLEELDNKIDELAQTEKEQDEQIKRLDTKVHESEESLQQLREKYQRSKSTREKVSSELEELESQLRDAKAEEKENERDQRRLETINELIRRFDGVYGRMTELLKIPERKFQLAVTVALGRFADAVVTDNEETAKECINYLKWNTTQRMEFLPLTSLVTKEPDAKLRKIGKSTKFVLDVLQFDSKIRKAVVYALGSTLVCNDRQEARHIALDGEERRKVVSTDGTMFNKSGLITGGFSEKIEAKASRFDRAKLNELQQKKREKQDELNELEELEGLRKQQDDKHSQIEQLKREYKDAEARKRDASEKLKESRSERNKLQAEREKTLPQINEKEESIRQHDEDIARVRQQMKHERAGVFEDFSRRVGISNILEREEELLQTQKEATEKRREFGAKRNQITSQLEFEHSKDMQKALDDAQGELQRLQSELADIEKAQKDHREKKEKKDREIEEHNRALQELRDKAEQVRKESDELKQRMGSDMDKLRNLRKEISSKESTIEKISEERKELLSQAKHIDQVNLFDQEAGGNGKEHDQADGMEVDNEGGGEEAEAHRMDEQRGTEEANDDAAAAVAEDARPLNYSLLSDEMKNARSISQRKSRLNEMEHDINQKKSELAKMNPNLRAINKYDELRNEEGKLGRELAAARKEANNKRDEFQSAKKERYHRFMEAFNQISEKIDPIYKEMTQGATHPHGGKAYLHLENLREPYLQGVRYTAMPPGKRFMDMDQLSGGEKSVAAVALLFAIHAYKPSPFFVLDEIDAALDANNIGKVRLLVGTVATFIRERSRRQDDQTGSSFQCIVISLKESFYHKANGLVGIMKDPEDECSNTFTLNLDQFEDKERQSLPPVPSQAI